MDFKHRLGRFFEKLLQMRKAADAEAANLVLYAGRMGAGRVADKAERLWFVHRRPVLHAVAEGPEDSLGILPERLHHLTAVPAPEPLLQRLQACDPTWKDLMTMAGSLITVAGNQRSEASSAKVPPTLLPIVSGFKHIYGSGLPVKKT